MINSKKLNLKQMDLLIGLESHDEDVFSNLIQAIWISLFSLHLEDDTQKPMSFNQGLLYCLQL